MKKGLLIVISGFSGAGKGTLVKAILARHDNYALSISATTRQPRRGEEDGRDYFFISREEFERRIEEGRFLEYARYVDNYYGTPKDPVTELMEQGRDVILEIDCQGAAQAKAAFPDAVLVFVTTKDASTLKKRLTRRGTETKEQIARRLKRAAEEADIIDRYDYILINDSLSRAVADFNRIVRAEHMKVKNNTQFISGISDRLKQV